MSNLQQMSATGTRFEIKPSKTCHIQYSFNEFVPREFPREREIKEQLTEHHAMDSTTKLAKKSPKP